jgi:hypothetical protein
MGRLVNFGAPICHQLSQRASKIHDTNVVSPRRDRVIQTGYRFPNNFEVPRGHPTVRDPGIMRLDLPEQSEKSKFGRDARYICHVGIGHVRRHAVDGVNKKLEVFDSDW